MFSSAMELKGSRPVDQDLADRILMIVFKKPLALFSQSPMTGFYRDGYCRVGAEDGGNHAVAGMQFSYPSRFGNMIFQKKFHSSDDPARPFRPLKGTQESLIVS